MLSTWLWLLGSNSQPSLQGLGLAQYAILITSPKLTIMLCMMNCGPSLSLQLKAAYARLKCVCDDWHYCIICFGISPLLVFPQIFGVSILIPAFLCSFWTVLAPYLFGNNGTVPLAGFAHLNRSQLAGPRAVPACTVHQ